MAWTHYEGQLQPTGRWPEAKQDFSDELVQSILFEMLSDLSQDKCVLDKFDGEIWIRGPSAWIRINPSGVIEMGEGAA